MDVKVHTPVATEYRIAISGGELYVKRWQVAALSTVPIILLHDSLGSVELWRDFPEKLALATGKNVIAYDRLGFGQSSAHPSQLASDFVTAEAGSAFRAVCTKLNIEQFIVMGHSVGGGMAACCAAAYPEQCQALITESAQAFVEDRTRTGIRAANEIFKNEKQFSRLVKYHGNKARWVLNSWVDTWLLPQFDEWDINAQLEQVKCPNLVVHGEFDEYGSLIHPERYARLTGGITQLEIIPGAFHIPHKENDEQIIALIAEFIRDLK